MPFCSLCGYPDKAVIERRISAGELSMTAASKIVGCHKTSVSRHMQNHVTPAIRDEIKIDVDKAHALNAVSALLEQYEIVQRFLKQAIDSGNVRDVAMMLKEGRKHIELSARLTGQLTGPSTQINLLSDPTFVWLKDTIINSLDPLARVKLSAKLEDLADREETIDGDY